MVCYLVSIQSERKQLEFLQDNKSHKDESHKLRKGCVIKSSTDCFISIYLMLMPLLEDDCH